MAFDFSGMDVLGLPKWLVILLAIWIITWKGFALWRSAQRKEKIWFVVLLVINTMGILEILYLFLFSKINLNKKSVNNINNVTVNNTIHNRNTNNPRKKRK